MTNIISAIIVTFNPDTEVLKTLIKSLAPQVNHIFIIDNGSSKNTVDFIRAILPPNGLLIDKGYNSGISEAINTGILEANKHHSSYVVCFDQDSLPAADMIAQLLSAIKRKIDDGIKVAAVGANYSDIKGDSLSPFVRLVGHKFQRIDCTDSEIVEVDHLITSGCLFTMSALVDIGYMEPKLFIDYVDTEWCLRAINKDYLLFGIGAAKMQHDLGDYFVKVFGRTIPVHSPLRNYYLVRNGVWLLLQPWVSLNWKTMHFIRLIKIYIVLSLLVGKKFENWRMMTKGIVHVIKGKMGRYHK